MNFSGEKLKKSYLGLPVLLPLFLSGCLTLDRMTMVYDIKEDLSGYVDVYADRVRSEETDPLEQQSEMAELYAGFEDRNGISDFEKEMQQSMPGYHDWTIAVRNKTEQTCDIHVRGAFDNFIESTIVKSSLVQYQPQGSRIAICLKSQELKDGDLPVILKIHYHGLVLEHNAMQVDPATNALVWDLSTFDDDLYFILASVQISPDDVPDRQTGFLAFLEDKYGEDLYACQSDQDCVGAKTDCCQGIKSISLRFHQQWQAYLDGQCSQIDCPQTTAIQQILPVCQQQRCALKQVDYSQATFSDCLQISHPQEQGACYLAVADRLKDISGCLYIAQKDLQSNCLQLLMPQVALKDEAICREEAIAADFVLSALCWQQIAHDTGSPHYCGNIQDSGSLREIQQQSQCYRETLPLVRSVSQCEPFEPGRMQNPNIGYLFGNCIQQMALKQGRPDICQRIPPGDAFYSYWFNCVTSVAEHTKNGDFCQDLVTRQAPADYSDAFSEAGCRRKVQQGHY